MNYYALNFDGFHDSFENIFGPDFVLTEDIDFIDTDLNETVLVCINDVNKLENIHENKIVNCQLMATEDAANLLIVGQDQYTLLINKRILKNKDFLKAVIYHELCHLYQLERLFKEKVIFWNYDIDRLSASEQKVDSAIKHLNQNGGHTGYWQKLADRINSEIKPIIPVKAFLSDKDKQQFFEALDINYFDLNFNGFKD